MCLVADAGGWDTTVLSVAVQAIVEEVGGTDPEDSAKDLCLLSPLCIDSAPFLLLSLETAHAWK